MKGLIVLMCALVAVQARSTAVSKSPARNAASLGENPWVVHLRIAVSTSGLLDTCAGSLIDSSWVLTAARCVDTSRFIWIRYGVVNVINPELVTEASIVHISPDSHHGHHDRIAVVNINRVVEFTANVAPVGIANAVAQMDDEVETPESATFCTFNDVNEDGPGEVLNCFDLELEFDKGSLISETETTPFDLGAPLVKDGVQIGVLTDFDHGVSTFVRPGDFLEWIEEETGLDFSSNVDAVVASADEGTKVIFVN